MEKVNKLNSKLIDIILIVLLVLVVLYEFLDFGYAGNEVLKPVLDMAVTRTLAGVFFLIIMLRQSFKVFNFEAERFVKALVSVIPCWLVVLNNLPVISLISGDAYITEPYGFIIPFVWQCLAIGFFEEIAFRGVFFLIFLKNHRSSKKSVFLTVAFTSIIFGLYHLFNLLEGASPGAVFMQVGYSALIGAMCAAVFLFTENIIVPIIMHAAFDFCGGLIPTLGVGSVWNTPTVIITAVLAVTAFIYMFVMFAVKYDIGRSDVFYCDRE